ncbi:N-acetyltransferase [Ramlibacter sp. RBP-2]|uniref:N-acetyltransferase n=1 Tax=Ramlibacter lithotrophicus TaxID=2606681 RepID=A0A7X6DFQ7_9BURK|nr:GNAT family N-acetyltransferase [Ramlibacter lithotrophicus]NKE66347.1 N-acetyltransferase [Ramlibacter lithotrophicus]
MEQFVGNENEDVSISKQGGRQRYEIAVAGELAGFVEYRAQGDSVALVHTEVLPRFEGRGLAGRLAEFALEDVRRQGARVVPSCSYIAKYIQRHPRMRDLVDPQHGGAAA